MSSKIYVDQVFIEFWGFRLLFWWFWTIFIMEEHLLDISIFLYAWSFIYYIIKWVRWLTHISLLRVIQYGLPLYWPLDRFHQHFIDFIWLSIHYNYRPSWRRAIVVTTGIHLFDHPSTTASSTEETFLQEFLEILEEMISLHYLHVLCYPSRQG